MLAVTSALAAEFASGLGIKEQVAVQPLGILASFVIISLASYIPIARGFTRKEPFSNTIFNPKVSHAFSPKNAMQCHVFGVDTAHPLLSANAAMAFELWCIFLNVTHCTCFLGKSLR